MSRRDRTRLVDDPATIGADVRLDRRTLPDRRLYKTRRDWGRAREGGGVDTTDFVNRLRESVQMRDRASIDEERNEAADTIEGLTKERDEAMRAMGFASVQQYHDDYWKLRQQLDELRRDRWSGYRLA